jgi:hypothetical protein
MKIICYSPLDATEMAFLADPENRQMREHWDRASLSLTGMLLMLSPT